ncbi:MAG: amino acid permease [Candidatus Aminicenantes bacterium]|nr:amino acid permease [Candidatus Aminicenantes bacterium]
MENDIEKNGLKRQLGLFPITNIVVANMIGTGIFTTSGLLMGGLKIPLLLIALWVIGGIIALCGALSYGEVGAAIPKAGGEYIFLCRLYHPMFGFLSGWVSLFAGFSAPIAAAAIGVMEYINRAFPSLLNPGLFQTSWEPQFWRKACAILVILIFTMIHARGLKTGARVQNFLTVMKVFLIAGLIAAGFLLGRGNPENFKLGGDFNFDFNGWKVIGLSLMWIMFSYSGWNAAAYIGSEVKNPSKNIPRSLFLGTGIVVLLYFMMNLFYVFALSPSEMSGVISIGGLAAGKLFGSSLGNVFSLLIAFALFSSLSAYIILGPRVYYAMSRDGTFFRFASKVHPKYNVPSQSIWLQGGLAGLMVLFGTFDQIITYMGFSLGVFPLMVVFGVFKIRRSGEGSYRLPGYPVVPIFYLLAGTAILFLGFLERPLESTIAVFMLLTGIPLFFLFRKSTKNNPAHTLVR